MTDRDDNLDLFPETPDNLLEHINDPEIMRKWPQGLTDMLDTIEAAHATAGDDTATARDRAFRAVRALAANFGGIFFYIPKGQQLDNALRNRMIWEELDGTNVPELAERYGLTMPQIYNILAEQRKLARKRHQRDLFESDDD